MFIAKLPHILKILKFLSPSTLVTSVLKNCCWHKFQDFCGTNHLGSIIASMTSAWLRNQNKSIFLCLNPECFYLFDRLLLTWISRFSWKQTSRANSLLRDDVIKTRKFLFIWMLIASVSLINFCWLVFLGFCRTNHDIYEPITGADPGVDQGDWSPPRKFNSIDFMRTKILSWILFYFCCNHPLLPYFYFISFFNYHYLILQR